jgi:hypothetical protein
MGLIEGPNREIDWHMVDDELHDDFNAPPFASPRCASARAT